METTLPTVSVVIPTADWDHMLWRLDLVLEGLCIQTVAPQEVIVVDSIGKTDKVIDLVAKYTDRLNIKAIKLPYVDLVFRTAGARNRGVSNLSKPCDRILFLDADCVPFPRVVEAHQKIHKPNLVGLGLRVYVANKVYKSIDAVYKAPVTDIDCRLKKKKLLTKGIACHSHHVSFCYNLFLKIGGFWPRVVVAEDAEIGMRAERAGGFFEYIQNPKVRHIDHPIWRPYADSVLPSWNVTHIESAAIEGYTREVPDFLKWGEL